MEAYTYLNIFLKSLHWNSELWLPQKCIPSLGRWLKLCMNIIRNINKTQSKNRPTIAYYGYSTNLCCLKWWRHPYKNCTLHKKPPDSCMPQFSQTCCFSFIQAPLFSYKWHWECFPSVRIRRRCLISLGRHTQFGAHEIKLFCFHINLFQGDSKTPYKHDLCIMEHVHHQPNLFRHSRSAIFD